MPRPLDRDPATLLRYVPSLGRVVARTRSAAAVLDCEGVYGEPDVGEHTGIVLGENIDLRIFPSGWHDASATASSIVVRNAAGEVVHEIVLGPASDRAAFDALVAACAVPAAPSSPATVESADDATPDDAVDVTAYREAYAAMQDTHDFFMLLRRFALEREQGLRLAGDAFARPVARDAHRALTSRARDGAIPLMLFVASDGMVQIASGPLASATAGPGGWTLAGAGTRLVLDETAIARAWVVRKPTSLGVVTSLELYAADGRLVLQIFGERHAGETEREDWRAATGALS